MSAAFELNCHHPECHNERVKVLIKKFQIKIRKASGEYSEIIYREGRGEKLCSADKARSSDLCFQILDNVRTIEQLLYLTIPEGN